MKQRKQLLGRWEPDFKLLFKLISWWGISQKWMITNQEEKLPSSNFFPQILMETGCI